MTTPILKKLDADDSKARIQEKINSNFARCGAWSLATGFVSDDNNANIGVDYNATDRTVILTGDFKAYHEGILVPELTDGWVSPSHDATTGVTYFLRHNGTQFLFDSNAWDIQHDLLIASLQNGTLKILLREVHGVDMSGIEHMRWHYEFGTGRYPNGMAFTNVTPNSTTPANRRPYISGVALMDEDLRTNLADLSTNSYCQRYLTGSSATGTRTFLTAQTDIVKLSGNQPLYNQWTGSAWTDTPFPNNHYGKIFLVAIPAGDNADSQSVRLMWVQPQQTSLDLDYIRNITSADIKHGDPNSIVAEYNFIGEWIIKYTASNWSITEFNELTGNRVQQTSGAAGYGLATTTTDGLMSSTDFVKLANILVTEDVAITLNSSVASASSTFTIKARPSFGEIHIRGYINLSASIATGTRHTIGTIESAYRPSTKHALAATRGTNATAMINADVTADGTIGFQTSLDLVSGNAIYISGTWRY